MKQGFPGTTVLLIVATCCALSLIAPAFGTTREVPLNYATIQLAINASAASGDDVLVDSGTYPEVINFNGKAIYLHSVNGAAVTIIDGTGLGDSVVTCASAEGPDTIIEGFTITGGSGDTTTFAFAIGGGILCNGGSPTVTRCIIDDNKATGGSGVGGGMLCSGASPIVSYCTFSNNTADDGGGLYNNNGSTPTLTNCRFIGNESFGNGGGVYSVGSFSTFVNCTFSTNTTAVSGGGMYLSSSDPTITNCIFWDIGSEIIESIANPTVTYCDIQFGHPGVGNIMIDPNFADADLRLSAGSPAIDAGNLFEVAPEYAVDFDGLPRSVDDPATADTGTGPAGLTVDMGAFEYPPPDLCPADFSGLGGVPDGFVDVLDLIDLLAAWGTCP